MSQLTRDYKGAGRRPPQMSGMKEFGLGVLAGALLAGGGAVLIAAHAHHGRHGTAGSACAARSGSVTGDPGRSSDTARSTPTPASQPTANAQGGAAATDGPPAATAAKRVPAPAPQYDFYQMLPKLTVPVAGARAAARQTAHAAKAPAEYLLQVGSYSSDAQARRLRERLARLGVNARIERITQHGRTFNRVRIGPVDAAQSAHIRTELAPAGIHPLVIPAP